MVDDKHIENTVLEMKIISSKIGFQTNLDTQEQSSIHLPEMKHQTCLSKKNGLSSIIDFNSILGMI